MAGDSLTNFMSGREPEKRRPHASSEVDEARWDAGRQNGLVASASTPVLPTAATLGKGGDSRGPRPLRWEHFANSAMPLQGDVQTFECTEVQDDDVYAVGIGPRLPAKGISDFKLTIAQTEGQVRPASIRKSRVSLRASVASTTSSLPGTAMLLGVVHDTGAEQGFWGKVWGMAGWNGKLYSFPEARTRDPSRKGELYGDALTSADLRAGVVGMELLVRVDANARRLYFKVRREQDPEPQKWTVASAGGEPIVLPSGGMMRPFARCAREGDAITIGHITEWRPSSAVPSDAPPPTLPGAAGASSSSSQLDKPRAAPALRSLNEMQLLAKVAALDAELEEGMQKLLAARKELEAERKQREEAEERAQLAEAATRAEIQKRGVVEERLAAAQRLLERIQQQGLNVPTPAMAMEVETALMREASLAGGLQSSIGDSVGEHGGWLLARALGQGRSGGDAGRYSSTFGAGRVDAYASRWRQNVPGPSRLTRLEQPQ